MQIYMFNSFWRGYGNESIDWLSDKSIIISDIKYVATTLLIIVRISVEYLRRVITTLLAQYIRRTRAREAVQTVMSASDSFAQTWNDISTLRVTLYKFFFLKLCSWMIYEDKL